MILSLFRNEIPENVEMILRSDIHLIDQLFKQTNVPKWNMFVSITDQTCP